MIAGISVPVLYWLNSGSTDQKIGAFSDISSDTHPQVIYLSDLVFLSLDRYYRLCN